MCSSDLHDVDVDVDVDDVGAVDEAANADEDDADGVRGVDIDGSGQSATTGGMRRILIRP